MMARKPNPERRTKFLDAALELFTSHGVQNTSTAAIAREAGTASGTLFLYFPTKQDLIHKLILKIGKEQSAYINSRLSPNLSVQETFFTIWDGSLRWFQQNMEAYQYVQQVRDSGMIDKAVVQESEKYFEYYYSAIQRGLGEGLIKPYPIELVGSALYQNIIGVMNLIREQPDPSKQDEYIHSGFKIFWDGIKAANEENLEE